MCGLAGITDFKGRPVERTVVQRMRECLHHRGPDDQRETLVATAAAGVQAGLGFCRLSIIDLSPLGSQPMASRDGRVTVVFNGEIYNHHEIRAELEREGVRFRSRADTEVLVELLARRWADGVKSLRGMFALAAVDSRTGRVLLARDRLGKKPLYYRFADGRLWFASEIKALLADRDVPREIDPEALDFYLQYQCVPAPRSIFKGIRKLKPAHLLLCDGQRCVEERYWELSFVPKHTLTFDEAVAETRRRVEEAVKIRLESDVPLGAFLSGGLDSSVVTAVMARALDRPVKTFSIGFEEAAFDERAYARQVASEFKTEHHEFVVRLDATESLPRLAAAYDEPFADSSALPTYHVSRITRQHVTVALSGDGGDEAFGGYERYSATVLASRLAQLARLPGVRAAGDALLLGRRVPESRSITRALRRFWEGVRIADDGERYALWMRGLDPALAARLMAVPALNGRVTAERILEPYRRLPALDPFDRMQRVDIETYLPDDLLVKVDRASMSHSLEVRAPFLDHELLEFAARLPVRVRNPGLRLKAVLKAAFPEIPASVRGRRKTGFGVPVAAWFRGTLGDEYAAAVLGPGSRASGWFDRDVARTLLEEHRSRAADHSTALWTLLMFEHWHRVYLG
jgi:asparagine synthase (glutamine-hydrolysing)